jgi:hypothetical protein
MLVLVGVALGAAAVFIAYRLTQVVTVQRVGSVVIRRPGLRPAVATNAPKGPSPARRHNLAPLATVSVSSIDANNQFGEGVADGIPDSRDWVSNGETTGAWIKLEWGEPVTVSEIELFDLPSLTENVLSGALVFDDGDTLPVPPLPPDGSPWRTVFPAKTVRSTMFRIDRAQGRSAGLAEIMVYGPVQ